MPALAFTASPACIRRSTSSAGTNRPRTVAVYHQPDEPTTVLNEQSTLDGEQVLPGLEIAVADLFRNVPRGE